MSRRLALVVLGVLASCSLPTAPAEGDHHEDGAELLGTTRSALTATDPVSAAVNEGCTTAIVKGLATQLIEEIQCLRPGTFASIEDVQGLSLDSAVFPWLQEPAQRALVAAQQERGVTMSINSALRTLPQQYLLYRWYKAGRCNIAIAAAPGKSNHEEGLAVDIQDNAGWRNPMKNHSFIWLGAGDPVHFDYKGEGAVDIGGLSVLAFQRLWNRNNAEDLIDEDGLYGPQTEARLSKSPIGGFALGADCSAPPPDPSVPLPGSGGSTRPSGDGGGGDDALGASGSRRTTDSDGCSMGRAKSASWPLGLALGALAAFMLRSRRRRG